MGTAAAPTLATLATARAGRTQRRLAGLVSLAFGAVTLALLPFASRPMPPMPGFVPVYQSALIVVYGLTTYLFLTHYRRTRSASLLVLGTGSLYVTLAVLLQMLSFPNVLAQGRILGNGPDTTTWLWTFWHLGPPLFALPYAIMEGDRRDRTVQPSRAGKVGALAIGGTLAAAALTAVAVTRYVHLLPKSVEGDDYWLLTTSGVGPTVVALTVLALAVLCWTTRLRTVLQLWLAVSLLLLVFDNMVTLPGAARGTVGWFAGRLEALVAGLILLGVYLREVDFLYARAETAADEREARRAELQLARDNLALALEAAEMGDWELDLRTGASRRTPRHDAIFGYPESVGAWGVETFLKHVVPEDRAMARATLEGANGTERFDLHCRIKRAGDGATRWIAVRGKAYLDGAGGVRALAGVVMDTTREREAEDRLNQAQKMEAIGQLTGGVAHDFNNLLTIIRSSVDFLRRPELPEARKARYLDAVSDTVDRAAKLTGQLLAFARRQTLDPQVFNIGEKLRAIADLLDTVTGARIRVVAEIPDSPCFVRADLSQFDTALVNMAVNARDAMDGEGALTLRLTCGGTLPPIRGHAGSTQPFAAISLIDTGTGIAPEMLERIFEPFFTTKEVGRGTGLGLSQVFGFAKQSGGDIAVSSVVGEGKTFTLYLPEVAAETAEREEAVEATASPVGTGQRVLVVEDNVEVGTFATQILEDLGYETTWAATAEEALDRLGSKGADFDVVFSDVVMPGMGGLALAKEMWRRMPHIPVLLASGYSHVLAQDDQHGFRLLHKPYSAEQLGRLLRQVAFRRSERAERQT